MKALKHRLQSLEHVARAGWERAHRVVQRLGQTESEAIDGYGRDRLGAHDLLIIRKIVAAPLGATSLGHPSSSIESEAAR